MRFSVFGISHNLFGTTVYAHLVPVKPAVLEKLLNSIAPHLLPQPHKCCGAHLSHGYTPRMPSQTVLSRVFPCIVDPLFKFFPRQGHSRRIIWETKVNNIHFLFWKFRNEIVFGSTRKIGYILKITIRKILSGPSCHNIAVNINRIYRVGNGNFVVQAKYLLEISSITFRPVAYKNLVLIKPDSRGI